MRQAIVSVPYGDCNLYKNDKEIVLEAVKKFPSPMGILVFIKKKLSELKLGDIFVVSVPYGDCSLYKLYKVPNLDVIGLSVSVPYGDCNLYKR